MLKPSKKTSTSKYYITGIFLSFSIMFTFIGVGYFLKILFIRLSLDQICMLFILCVTLGVFIGETWHHSKTRKELKDLKESLNKQEQSTD